MCVSTTGAQILGAWAQNFVWWVLIFSAQLLQIFLLCIKMCISSLALSRLRQVTDVCRSFQNCWSSVTLLKPRIWKWLLDFWKICGQSLTSELSDFGIYINIFGCNFLVILFILLITDSEAMFVVFALLFSYHPED